MSLTTPLVESGVTRFRERLYLCVPLDEQSDQILLSAASALEVEFQSTLVTVQRSTSAWIAEWQGDDETITVELKYPAPIQALYQPHFARARLFRVDGDAVADEPTLTVSTGSTLSEPFVAPRFRAEFFQKVSKILEQSLQIASARARAARALVQPAQTNQLQLVEPSLGLAGVPSSPRLRLLDPSEQELLWQWIEPGAHATRTYTAAAEDLALALAPALERAASLARERAEDDDEPPPTRLVLPLLIESDAPCRVVVRAAQLDFTLSAELLTQSATLAFAGGTVETAPVLLPPPPGVPLTLTLEGSLLEREPRSQLEPPALADSARHTGVQLTEGTSASSVWHAERPYRSMGFAVALRPISAGVKLVLTLFADDGGRSAATPLAEGTLELERADPSYARFRWKPIELQPGRYWLRLLAASGTSLWLGTPAVTSEPILFQHAPSELPAPAQGGVPLSLLRHPLEPALASDGASSPLALALNGVPLTIHASPAGEAVSAELDFASSGLDPAGPWVLEATSATALELTVRSVRATYRASSNA